MTRHLVFPLLMVTLALTATPPASRAQWVKTTHSLSHPYVSALAVSGTRLFAGTWGKGVFVSTDDGTSWTELGRGLTDAGITAFAIVGESIFAGTWGAGMYRSSINGGPWIPVNDGLPVGSINGIAVSGNDLFVGTPGLESVSIFRSTDLGASWNSVNSNLPPTNVYCLAFFDTNLIIGTNQGVFRSTDKGASWSAGDSGICNYETPESIVVFGENLYAPTLGGGICFSTDMGKTWAQITSDLADTHILSLTVSGSNLFTVTRENGVFISTDNGASWTPRGSGLPQSEINHPAPVGFVTVSGTKLFAGTEQGVFLSSNDGVSWSGAHGDLAPYEVSSLSASGVNLFAGTSGGGVFRSSNDGGTWNPVNSGLTDDDVNALALNGSNLFAGTAGGVFLSTNNGTDWGKLSSGPSNAKCVAATGTNVVLASKSPFSPGIFRSTDGGATWSSSGSTDVSYININSFEVLEGRILAGTEGRGVLISTDEGSTWVRSDSGMAKPARVTCTAMEGTNIFAGTADKGIYRSTDEGTTWNAVNNGLPQSWQEAYALVASGSNVIASFRLRGVYLSTNSGSSWNCINDNIMDSTAKSLAVLGDNLFAGTPGAVWRRLLSEAVPIQLASFEVQRYGSSGFRLTWSTASEINNYGFEVQRSPDGKSFASIAGSFVPGNGTTNLSHTYLYVDADPAGTSSYRLKQMDLDGTVNYSNPVLVATATAVDEQKPVVFGLEQNYPNPFNPSTIIRYGLPHKSVVSLTVFNTLGQQIATLVQGEQEAGYHEVRFSAKSGSASGGDGTSLASGLYFYRLQAGDFVLTKKLLLVR